MRIQSKLNTLNSQYSLAKSHKTFASNNILNNNINTQNNNQEYNQENTQENNRWEFFKTILASFTAVILSVIGYHKIYNIGFNGIKDQYIIKCMEYNNLPLTPNLSHRERKLEFMEYWVKKISQEQADRKASGDKRELINFNYDSLHEGDKLRLAEFGIDHLKDHMRRRASATAKGEYTAWDIFTSGLNILLGRKHKLPINPKFMHFNYRITDIKRTGSPSNQPGAKTHGDSLTIRIHVEGIGNGDFSVPTREIISLTFDNFFTLIK